MSATFKFSVQPFIDNVLGYLDADDPGTETDDVSIVMHLGKSGTVAFRYYGCPDPSDLVGCQGNADSRTADADAAVNFTAGYCLADSVPFSIRTIPEPVRTELQTVFFQAI